MEKYKTDINIQCTCGERLYHPGSWTDFKEDSFGNLTIVVHVAPCPKCSKGSPNRSSCTKEYNRAVGFREVVKVSG